MNYTNITLGELLSSENETIKRNAIGILKALQKKDKKTCVCCGEETFMPIETTKGIFCQECWQ